MISSCIDLWGVFRQSRTLQERVYGRVEHGIYLQITCSNINKLDLGIDYRDTTHKVTTRYYTAAVYSTSHGVGWRQNYGFK